MSSTAGLGEVNLQRAYYASTAERYDFMHGEENPEHSFALSIMIGAMEHLNAQSVLDVGAGTGRAVAPLLARGYKVVGIEPVAELREQGYRNGIGRDVLRAGDGYNLEFPDNSFDIVCEFGVLHHVKHHERVVAEMLRVARTAVFISDCNNFGQGSRAGRLLKQVLHAGGLWPAVNFIKTRGKGYSYSEGDGIYYSYSIFDSYPQLARACSAVHVVNTTSGGADVYRTCSHGALLGIK